MCTAAVLTFNRTYVRTCTRICICEVCDREVAAGLSLMRQAVEFNTVTGSKASGIVNCGQADTAKEMLPRQRKRQESMGVSCGKF